MKQFDHINAFLSSDSSTHSAEDREECMRQLKQISKELKVKAFLAKKYKSDFGVIRTFLDTSTRETKKRSEELVDINIKLERFAYTVAHDLKAPIRTILNFASLLEQHLDEADETAKELLSFISISSKQMNSLVEETLAFSKVNNEEVKREMVDLNDIVGFVKELIPKEENHQFVIKTTELPIVIANRAMMHKLFLNLIQNGLKYNQSAEKIIQITVNESESHYLFSLSDNGIGIKKEDQERVFKLYTRLHNGSQYQGTGIGLALCKKIIQNHGGDISISSNEDNGSVFNFSIQKMAS